MKTNTPTKKPHRRRPTHQPLQRRDRVTLTATINKKHRHQPSKKYPASCQEKPDLGHNAHHIAK
ncbi:hypothetical protein [Methylomonas sp. CM2]|uniref:hypothetical protein n=1 Tax=Methylomonas sp. CM2 TaxID=3417647 RepID=UPI003CF0850E